MAERRILVTGASGFIGGRVVERLVLEGMAPVRAMVRAWSRAARVARFDIDVVAADLMVPDQVDAALRGVTHVVHCAYTDEPTVIVEGTRNVLTAALAAGVERLVFLSTAEVYRPHLVGEVDEASRIELRGNRYADAKIGAEELCREFGARGLRCTILRPSIVYGPFGKAWTCNIAKRLQSGQWGEFERYGDGYCNAVYVDDLVSAIILAMDCEAAAGNTFNVNGPEVLTWNAYFRRFNEALGLPPLTQKSAAQSAIRTAAVAPLVRVADVAMSRFGEQLAEIYLRGGVLGRMMHRAKTVLQSTPSHRELGELFSRRAIYTDEKARTGLGYRPQFDLDRGLALSALWLNSGGFIDVKRVIDASRVVPEERSGAESGSAARAGVGDDPARNDWFTTYLNINNNPVLNQAGTRLL
jgi:nucleoside-diphosphate-sugar epimerase